jgi:acyl dehydratase
MALLTDELRSWIGREVHYPAREELGRASIRYFALALGDDNPLYVDDAYAREAGYASAIAPPTLVCETCQYAHRPPDEHGYIGHSWDLPVEGCRLIRAGNDYEFFRPILPEDRISVTWTLEDIVERPSSRGAMQLYVSSVARYRDASGALVAVNRESIVYQPLASAP